MAEQAVQFRSKPKTGGGDTSSEVYRSFTLNRYNSAILGIFSNRRRKLAALFLCSVIAGILLPQTTVAQSSLDVLLQGLKLTWLVPVLYFLIYNLGLQSFPIGSLALKIDDITRRVQRNRDQRVIFTVVTKGNNIDCVGDSVRSALYWTRRISEDYDFDLSSEVWVITEEEAYDALRERYDELAAAGARIFAVPRDFATANHSMFKARALCYALLLRRNLGYCRMTDWVYHQDEETAVGEDTVLGIADFISNSEDKRVYGGGIILYPQKWENGMTHSEEFVRSSGDLGNLHSLRHGGLISLGHHGSHFLCRADVEDSVGWDLGEIRAEDWLFILNLLENGMRLDVLKGFAYEQAPFSLRDSLKQRRRWILGYVELLRRSDVRAKYKIPVAYLLVCWFCAAPSLITVLLSIIHPTAALFPGSALLAGFVWYSMYDACKSGYDLNKTYLRARPKSHHETLRLGTNAAAGLLTDALAPWYTLLRRTSSYECVTKDLPKPSSDQITLSTPVDHSQ